jgi:hypothetical protein
MNVRDAQLRGFTRGKAALCALALVATAIVAQPAWAQLPPRPEEDGLEGASIQLWVEYPRNWPWGSVHWQQVVTAVEWRDGAYSWHQVEGWQGAPDQVHITQQLTVVALKTWWVAEDDLGTGPFRWTVRLAEGGDVLGTTEPFTLPMATGGMEIVEVLLHTP